MKVHTTINGLTRDELVHALGRERQRRKDIKEVWSQWERKPSKVELAHALWAVLEQKIDVCKVDGDAEVPTVAIVVNDAYRIAQRWRYLSFVLGEEQPTRET
jgi:hypothetical protein